MSATEITIFASVLGLLIAAACISIPQFVRSRSQGTDDSGRAYLEETGRSAHDIEESNASLLEEEARSPGEGGTAGSG